MPPAFTSATALRATLVVAQLATIASTWPLWEAARETPLLPCVAPLAAVPFGALVVLSALGVLEGSRFAAALHAAVLGLAMLGDAHRLQPAPISIAMLLAILAGERIVDRRLVTSHLAAVWLASGLGKLASNAFASEIAPQLVSGLAAHLPDGTLALTPLVEVSLGVAILAPGSRPIAATLGGAFHLAVLALLVSIGWNRGVWAWNLALSLTAWSVAGARGASWVELPRARRTLAAHALLSYPLLHPLGLAPPSTAFFVYGGLEPVTLVCDRAGVCTLDREIARSIEELEAPLPGSVALLRASFEAGCVPGERWLARERSGDETLLAETTCPRESP